jgi:S1-C subfamily serine protease
MIQIDGSVNAGNSGGPLLDATTGDVIGLVTRKATGLTKAFDHLRTALIQNYRITTQARGLEIMGIDPYEALGSGFASILHMMSEIERQANVGIGYAISSKHLRDESVINPPLG